MTRVPPWLCGAFPLLFLVWVAGPAGAVERQDFLSRSPDCDQRGTVTTCSLPFPERGSSELFFDVPVAEVTGFRLYADFGGDRWLAAEGRWHPSPVARHSIAAVNPRQGGPLRGPVLRLELYGTSRPPRLLAYGAWALDPDWKPEPEAETPYPLPPLPTKAWARFPLEDLGFQASWTVRAKGAAPGDVVRLDIPPEVYAESRQWYLVDLRMAVGDEQIPYAIDYADSSRLVASGRLRPVPGRAPGWSRLEAPGLRKGLPFTTLHLTAPPMPFSRQVLVAGFDEGPWICRPNPPLPCRLSVDPTEDVVHPRKLTIDIRDGEEAPLPELSTEVWASPEALLFVWPEQGPVRLLIGSDERKGSVVLLDSLDPVIRERPWKAASVERIPEGLGVGALPVASFAAAGLVLLGLIAREARRRKVALLFLMAVLPARGALAAPETGSFFTRTVEVSAAGWVQVPLEPETLRHFGPDGRRSWAIGPGGEELPVAVEIPGEGGLNGAIWQSQITMSQGELRYSIDLGENPRVHDRVSTSLWWREADGGPTKVSLEVSDDGEVWRPLPWTLIQTGFNRGAQLMYPATSSRFLRFSLPPQPYGPAGLPFDLAVYGPASAAERSVRTVPLTPVCRRGQAVGVCRIRLPGAGQLPVALYLDLASGDAAGFRLYTAGEGRWRLLAEGLWAGAAPGRRTIPVSTEGRLASDLLRLEVYGAAGPPLLSGADVDLVVPYALFQASQPGLYRLIYGDGAPWNKDRAPYMPEEASAVRVEPSPEIAHPLPPLPVATVSPGRPLRDFRRAASWEVRAPGVRSGEVVRLEVPVDALLRAGPLERLRLETGGRQIPFVRWLPPEPALALESTGEQLLVPAPAFELTNAQVTSWSTIGMSKGWHFLNGQPGWGCRPSPVLPCRLEGGPRDPVSGVTEIELDFDGSTANPHVTLWRRRHALVFVWPAEGPVRLLAGDKSVTAPRYDIAAIEDLLLVRPWKPAVAGPAEGLPKDRHPGLRLGGIALAGIALLVLIHKMLPAA